MRTPDHQVGQAVFTWRKLRTGQAGYDFAALSPALRGQSEWLEASAGPLTGFVGNSRPTSEQRRSYKPIGRHVSGERAIAYRKEDAGNDGYDRVGNYIVHFLVAPVELLSLSDILRLPEKLWVSASDGRLNPNLELKDIPVADIRRDLGPPLGIEVQVDHTSHILNALYELVQHGSISVTGWLQTDILALLATMPAWVDYAIRLVPTWSDDGPQQRLELVDTNADAFADAEDHRCAIADPKLETHRQLLLNAADIAQIRLLLWPEVTEPHDLQKRLEETPAASGTVLEEDAPEELEVFLRKWVTGSVQELKASEKLSILERPVEALQTLVSINQQIPSARKPESFTLSFLEHCGDVDSRLIARVLPVEDDAVAMYVALCHSNAVLEAALLLNSDRTRTIDLTFQTNVPAATVQHIIQRSQVDEDIYRGLIRSLEISSLGAGSFARRVLLANGIDLEYVYSALIPAASVGRDDALLSLACINPDAFVRWLRVPAPYERALVNALRQETRQKAWERISRYAARWRRH
jgi:hypothetical protein